MSKKSSNAYEAVLAWGYEHIDVGVKYSDFDKFVDDRQLGLNAQRRLALFRELFRPLEAGDLIKGYVERVRREDHPFQLTVDASFRYLELVELHEARAGSRNAMRLAAVSFALAAIVGALQVHLALDCSAKAHLFETLVCEAP